MSQRRHALRLALAVAIPAMAPAASPATADQLAAVVQETDIPRARDGLFYVDVLVNGQPIHFLVDTGANVMVLTGADAARLGLTGEDGGGAQITTAGGRARMKWATLDHVQLAGREMRDMKAAVVPSGLPVSLLGQSMLSKLGSLTIEGDRLRMR